MLRELIAPMEKVCHVTNDSSIGQAFQSMTLHKVGYCYIVDNNGSLAGIFTDGDFRRVLSQSSYLLEQLFQIDIAKVASKKPFALELNPKHNNTEDREIIRLFKEHNIYDIPVVKEGKLIGNINIRDALRIATLD